MRHLLPRISLRLLLLLAALVGLVPLCIVQTIRLQEDKAAALVNAERHVQKLAQNVVSRHDEFAQRSLGLLNVLAKMPEVRQAQPACGDILRELQATQLWITSLELVDAAGRGICGTQADGFTVSGRAYFREMTRTRSFTLSEVIDGSEDTRDVMVALLPLLGTTGELERALVLGLDTNWISRVSAEMSGIPGATMFVIDRQGRHIFSSSHAEMLSDEDATFYRQLGETPDGAVSLTPPLGEPSLFGIRRIADIGVTIAVGVPRAIIEAPIERRFALEILLIVAAGLASFAVTVLFVELAVVRGLQLLKRFASGLPASTPGATVALPPSVAEVNDLAHSFNSMVTQLEGLAYHDRLTGLGNRRLLDRLLANAANSPGPFAVLAIDLDAFKPVNDAYGHRAGDQVLVQIAERLRAAIPEAALVARTGGDEFIVVLHRDRAATRRIAVSLRDAVSHPCPVDDVLVQVGCCVGVAFVEDGVMIPDATEMLDRADEALYEAKRAGRSRIVVASSQVERLPRQRLAGGVYAG